MVDAAEPPREFPRTVILRKGAVAVPAGPLADGTPLWRIEHGSARDSARHAFVSDPALAEWFSTQRHTDVMAVRGRFLDDGGVLLERVDPLGMPASSFSPAPDLAGVSPTPDGPLAEFGRRLRAYLERRAWPEWLDRVMEEPSCPPGSCPAHGMCRVTTALALAILRAHDPDGEWEPDGGHPTVAYYGRSRSQFRTAYKDLDGGMWDRSRAAWDGHYWIRGGRDGVLFDLTADQFGWEPVTVAGPDDPRYRASYRPATVLKDLKGGPKTRAWCEHHARGGKRGARKWARTRRPGPRPPARAPRPGSRVAEPSPVHGYAGPVAAASSIRQASLHRVPVGAETRAPGPLPERAHGRHHPPRHDRGGAGSPCRRRGQGGGPRVHRHRRGCGGRRHPGLDELRGRLPRHRDQAMHHQVRAELARVAPCLAVGDWESGCRVEVATPLKASVMAQRRPRDAFALVVAEECRENEVPRLRLAVNLFEGAKVPEVLRMPEPLCDSLDVDAVVLMGAGISLMPSCWWRPTRSVTCPAHGGHDLVDAFREIVPFRRDPPLAPLVVEGDPDFFERLPFQPLGVLQDVPPHHLPGHQVALFELVAYGCQKDGVDGPAELVRPRVLGLAGYLVNCFLEGEGASVSAIVQRLQEMALLLG